MDVSDRRLQVLLTQQEYRRIPSNPPVRATTLRVRPLFLTQQAKILTTLLLFVRIFAFADFVRGLTGECFASAGIAVLLDYFLSSTIVTSPPFAGARTTFSVSESYPSGALRI